MQDFPARLALALKALNLSPGAFGAAVGVDKSVMSRWLAGKVRPSSHNLSRIAGEIARHRPGFSLLVFEGPMEAYAAFVAGQPTGAPASAPRPPERSPPVGVSTARPAAPIGQTTSRPIHFHSLAMSDHEAALSGEAYLGMFAMFRHRAIDSRRLHIELIHVFRDAERLSFRMADGNLQHSGPALLMKRQLYLLGESDSREDGLMFILLNGVGGVRAMAQNGIMTSVAVDRFFTPYTQRVLMVRIADPSGDEPRDAARFDGMVSRLFEHGHETLARGHLTAHLYRAIDIKSDFLGTPNPSNVVKAPIDQGYTWAASDPEGPNLVLPDLARILTGEEPPRQVDPDPEPFATAGDGRIVQLRPGR